MKLKKTVSVFVAILICLLSLTSCSGDGYALTVDSAKVSDGIFGYYYSVAVNSPQYNEVQDKQALAGELCAEYVAGNELIKKYNVSLSAKDKVTVSAEVKTNWQMYSSFYEKYSVSKQTLCLILEYENLINNLVEAIYSENGVQPLSEAEVSSFFNTHYASIKVMFTPFNEEMTQQEIEDITDKYTEMGNIVRSGGEMSTAAEQYPDLAEYEDKERIISSFDTSYPDGMFEKIVTIKNGDAQVLRYNNGIYLVKKCDGSSFAELYKSECIVKMKKGQVLADIQHLAKESKVEFNNRITSKIMKAAEV